MKFHSFIPAACGAALALALIACGPPSIDKAITTGSYDGFTIGDSAAKVYLRFRDEALPRNLPTSTGCNFAGPESTVLARMEPHAGVWKRWAILAYRPGDADTLTADFLADTVASTTTPALAGQGYDSAYARLREVVRSAGYDSLDFRLIRKDLEKPLAACMIDTAFEPVYGPWKIWSIGYESNCDLDQIQLFLKDGILDRIYRTRYCNLGL